MDQSEVARQAFETLSKGLWHVVKIMIIEPMRYADEPLAQELI